MVPVDIIVLQFNEAKRKKCSLIRHNIISAPQHWEERLILCWSGTLMLFLFSRALCTTLSDKRFSLKRRQNINNNKYSHTGKDSLENLKIILTTCLTVIFLAEVCFQNLKERSVSPFWISTRRARRSWAVKEYRWHHSSLLHLYKQLLVFSFWTHDKCVVYREHAPSFDGQAKTMLYRYKATV